MQPSHQVQLWWTVVGVDTGRSSMGIQARTPVGEPIVVHASIYRHRLRTGPNAHRQVEERGRASFYDQGNRSRRQDADEVVHGEVDG